MVDTPITSETLQQSYRNSFPSQIGAQRDLHVSDVIIPIVDLTPASEGSASNLSQALQEAIDYVNKLREARGVTPKEEFPFTTIDENSDIKKNRLELLQMFCKTYNSFIDFSKVEGV